MRQMSRSLTAIAVTIVLAAAFVPAASAASSGQDMTLDQLMPFVHRAAQTPARIRFVQDVDVRALLMRWQFSTVVERNGSNVSVEAKGAPSFISPEFLADLADFEKALADYRLEYEGRDVVGGVSYHLIRAVRRPELSTGAEEARMWVDPSSYLIKRMELAYPWGLARLEQSHKTIGGYTVLDRQEATVSLLSSRITVQYKDYSFGR